MTRGFSANVSTKKPRTRISRVLTELTSQVEEDEPGQSGDSTRRNKGRKKNPSGREKQVSKSVSGNRKTEKSVYADSEAAQKKNTDFSNSPEAEDKSDPGNRLSDEIEDTAEIISGTMLSEKSEKPETEAPGKVSKTGASDLPDPLPNPSFEAGLSTDRKTAGRDRIAALRERLVEASKPPVKSLEPGKTAATVREVIEDLRARVDEVTRERMELSETLDRLREDYARIENDLSSEKKARSELESLAEERDRIADEAVAEAEALAEERDQMLAELLEQRRIDDEQAALLEEAEKALSKRAAEIEEIHAELAGARDLLNIREVEIAEMKSKLESELSERARMESRCRKLENEIISLKEATEALTAIEALVTKRSR